MCLSVTYVYPAAGSTTPISPAPSSRSILAQPSNETNKTIHGYQCTYMHADVCAIRIYKYTYFVYVCVYICLHIHKFVFLSWIKSGQSRSRDILPRDPLLSISAE